MSGITRNQRESAGITRRRPNGGPNSLGLKAVVLPMEKRVLLSELSTCVQHFSRVVMVLIVHVQVVQYVL